MSTVVMCVSGNQESLESVQDVAITIYTALNVRKSHRTRERLLGGLHCQLTECVDRAGVNGAKHGANFESIVI